MAGVRKNGWWIYDVPVWKDWLAYWTVVAVYAGLAVPESRATVIDAVFAVLFQFALFAYVPGKIRQKGRVRRREQGLD